MSKKLADNVAVLNIKGQIGEINPVVIWDDKNVALIDTGMPLQFELFKSEMAELGLSPSQVTHILLTHQDIDHIGCVKEFLEVSPNIEVIAHSEEAPYISGQKVPLKLAVLEENLENLSPEKLNFYKMLKGGFENRQISITKTVNDGDILAICGGIKVVHTPGHTMGHACYYLQQTKVLVCGDAVTAANGILQLPNPVHAYQYNKAVQSLEKFLKLDIQAIVAYHGGIVAENIHQSVASILHGT